MRNLKDILMKLGISDYSGDPDRDVKALAIDSRQVMPGAVFFAVKGTATDGHSFIENAIDSGACAIVCSVMPETLDPDVVYITVGDVQGITGRFASEFYGNPSEQLQLVGVTGTNGKTSICTMLYGLFSSLGYDCGLISTVEYIVAGRKTDSTHTTPDPVRLNAMLAEMVEAGCGYCFMEVSSHAIVQGRINGLRFRGGVFSNITHDHLDYHGTFDHYLKAKKMFFDNLPDDAFALTNKDDRNGMVMMQNTRASRYTYALKSSADFKCRILESDFNGMLLSIGGQETWFGLVGRFNAYNLLAAYATAFLLGVDNENILTALSAQGRVNGRFEVYRSSGGITGIVDYAHTPDALENVLQTIRNIRTGNEQLITITGCGGNRDREKRPVMGNVAARMSDRVILTSDNPRDENPDVIINDMMQGVQATDYKKVLRIADRKEAIRTAVMMSKPGDIILVAGKGHETYQEIRGVKHPFDDRKILAEMFEES